MENRKKILFIVPSYFPAKKYGGPIESIHTLCKGLARKGFEVTVFTTNAGIEDPEYALSSKKKNLDGVQVIYFKNLFSDSFIFSLEMVFSIFLNIHRFNMIWVNSVWDLLSFFSIIVCNLKNRKFILSPRGALNIEAIRIKSKYKKLAYLNFLLKGLIKNHGILHFTTKDEKKRVLNYLKLDTKSFIVPNAIRLEEFKLLPQKGEFLKNYPFLKRKRYLLFLGRIHQKKGFDILVPAFYELTKLYSDLYLVIAGPDNERYKNKVDVMFEKFSLKEKVLYVGILSGNQKLSSIIDADLFILPSYSENFGMAPVEAMACGTPIVITNRVGIYDDVKEYDAGIVINTKTEDIVEGVSKVLNDKQYVNKITTNAKKLLAERYDLERVIALLMMIFENRFFDFCNSTQQEMKRF